MRCDVVCASPKGTLGGNGRGMKQGNTSPEAASAFPGESVTSGHQASYPRAPLEQAFAVGKKTHVSFAARLIASSFPVLVNAPKMETVRY